MRPTAVSRFLARLVSIGFVVATAGCGLGDYEEKMAEAQGYIDHVDKEDKVLADGFLRKPDKVKDPLEVFVRPPRGVSTTAEEKPYSDRFWVYQSGSEGVTVYLGWPVKKEKLRDKVLKDFPGKERLGSITTVPWQRDGYVLDRWTGEEGERKFDIYMTPDQTFALVYAVSKQAKMPPEAVQMSLNTLALGAEAAKQRSEFAKRRKGDKKK